MTSVISNLIDTLRNSELEKITTNEQTLSNFYNNNIVVKGITRSAANKRKYEKSFCCLFCNKFIKKNHSTYKNMSFKEPMVEQMKKAQTTQKKY